MKRALALGAAALLASTFTIRDAQAAGLTRPNVVGARAIGMGGAFTAIADDPTAVWYNPSGIAIYGENVGYIGVEVVAAQRSYTPAPDSPLGMAGITTKLTENTSPTLIPVIGVSTRFGFGKNAPARFAFALLAYDPYGGSISYSPTDIASKTVVDPNTMKPKVLGLQSTQILDFELTPTLAYQINDILSVGAGLRIGINSFSVNDTESAFAAVLNGSGVGLGGVMGVMVKPHKLFQVGAVYRTPLSASISGSGPLTVGTDAPATKNFGLDVTWPQSAGLGLAIFAHRRLTFSFQADWTAWSSIQNLTVNIAGLPQVKEMRYLDSYSIHAGVQGVITRFLVARIGGAFDSNAIPDRTVRRENEDNLKGTVAAGLGVHFWKVFIDGAFEVLVPGPARVVTTPVTSAAGTENETGSYSAVVYTAELSAQIRF